MDRHRSDANRDPSMASILIIQIRIRIRTLPQVLHILDYQK